MKKACVICGSLKPMDEFHRHDGARDGRDRRCIECHRAVMRANRAAKRDYYNAMSREHYRNNVNAYRERIRAYRETKKGREVYIKTVRTAEDRHPERRMARQALRVALRSGRMTRPATCEACGAACRPHGHHPDYAEPLRVQWLCQTCHVIAHHGPDTPAAMRHREVVDAPVL